MLGWANPNPMCAAVSGGLVRHGPVSAPSSTVLESESLFLPKGAQWPAPGTVLRITRTMISFVTPRGSSKFSKEEWPDLFKKNNPGLPSSPTLSPDTTYYVAA